MENPLTEIFLDKLNLFERENTNWIDLEIERIRQIEIAEQHRLKQEAFEQYRIKQGENL